MPQDRRLTVYLIRHGETFWNREGRCQGVTDVPLTEKGYCQAHAIAKALEGKSLSLVLSGPLQRTRETAAIIADSHGLSVETREELREWNQGELEGLTGVELLGNHRAFFERWYQDPAGTAPPGGESLQVLQERAWPVIDSLRERALNGPVAVVSHTMTIGTILCAALGLDLAHIHRLKLDIASRSTITFAPFGLFSAWVLTTLNDRHHLADELR
ncbi:MAG: histidine phosphatase family protein [Deltaproteobacteria bacterium]|nr:histidine phosphatase family protein [Deltaproteobacteria bacterium]